MGERLEVHYKQGSENAKAIESEIRAAARELGLVLRCSEYEGVGKKAIGRGVHWMFEFRPRIRVADYWPSKGTYRFRSEKVGGKARDPWHMIQILKEHLHVGKIHPARG